MARGQTAARDRCPTCGRLTLETAAAKFRRLLMAYLPPDTHARVGTLLNQAAEVGREPAAILLLAFDVLARDLGEQGVDVDGRA